MLGKELIFALIGTGATCLATVLGAALVFIFKKDMSPKTGQIFLGFAAGVMTAAAVFSLLLPAMDELEAEGKSVFLPVGGGFVLGALFLFVLDRVLPHMHIGSDEAEGLPSHFKKTTMLVFAVTLHNIPEGMAVGLAFAAAANAGAGALPAAIALAAGMALQNFPEGAAVSLPLRSGGTGKGKSFLCGALSGIVEPVFGILAVLIAGSVSGLMPWFLSFAAGAMVYVVVEELIPEAHLGQHSHIGTASVLVGFFVMMMLDVMLG